MLNRKTLFDAIEAMLPPAGQGALLLLRTQRVREYEASFGYAAVDQLADACQQRLQDNLREIDQVVRIGECDFAVLLPGVAEPGMLELAAAKAARLFNAPLVVDAGPVRASMAVGGCVAVPGHNPEAICRDADQACSQAQLRNERYALHEGPQPQALQRDRLEEALNGNRLELYLQPIFALASGRLCGFEALSRWHDPLLGQVPPERFVVFAEQTGLIDPLTRWSINAALRHCAPTLRENEGLCCAINLSPLVLRDGGFEDQLASALRIWDVNPSQVVMEITETALVDDAQTTGRVLSALSAQGVGISVDDFGTGYSSMAYFRHFPVDELKIDMSFVRDIVGDSRLSRLVGSMIQMAHSMDARVVAEGIETSAVWNQLRAMGCDMGQGYYPGRPLPAQKALALVPPPPR